MALTPTAKGSISKVKDKKSDKHPAYQGSLTFAEDVPAGTKLWLSAWINEGDNGPYLGIQASFPQEKTASAGITRPAKAVQRELDDEIPF